MSLRTYLLQTGQYKRKRRKNLSAHQQYVETSEEDMRIRLLRQVYRILSQAYDDRLEWEKDIWDLRKLGLSVNLTASRGRLNFALIPQQWLRDLAKEALRYRLAVNKPSTCEMILQAVRCFARFLTARHSDIQSGDIDRALIVDYIHYLRESRTSEQHRATLLIDLRIFFETCTHQLQLPTMTKELVIFDDDLPKPPVPLSREIPPEVLLQLREHLPTLPTTTLRMVVILLEVGMRVSELCSLPQDCLVRDDRNEWYLQFFQGKSKREHIIPLVDEAVVEVIQAQQRGIRERLGNGCQYLFPRPSKSSMPFHQGTFRGTLNSWAVSKDIRNQSGQLYRFTAHQFRHSVGMRLINDDVPIETISRLLGHGSIAMTERYARKRAAQVRADLERVHRKRRTVNYQGQIVQGDAPANAPEVQMLRQGIRGQTLPVGGCGRLIVLGGCPNANSCITCTFWLTSTDDLPALKSFYARAVRLRQRAQCGGNEIVAQQQDRIIPLLALRIKSLEAPGNGASFGVDDMLFELRDDLAEAASALEEIQQAGLIQAAKFLEQTMNDLRAKIAALEDEE